MKSTEEYKRRQQQRKAEMTKMFNHLYNVKRLRIDDCYAEIADKFFLSVERVKRILTK